MDWLPNENLLTLANRHEKGVLINDNLGDNVVGLYKGFCPKELELCYVSQLPYLNLVVSIKVRKEGEARGGLMDK